MRVISRGLIAFIVSFGVPCSGWTVTQLTDDDRSDHGPDVSGDVIVWNSYDGTYINVFAHVSGSTMQLTTDGRHEHPAISGTTVAWESRIDDQKEIFIYDLDTGVTNRLSNNTWGDYDADVSQNLVAWVSQEPEETNVWLYDGTTSRQLPSTSTVNHSPRVSDSYVAWEAQAANRRYTDIMLYDGSRTTCLTDGNSRLCLADISEDYILWLNHGKLQLYDIDLKTTTDITDGSVRCYGADLAAGYIALALEFGYDETGEIFLYEIASGNTTRVTHNLLDDYGVSCSYPFVTWQGSDWYDDEIFVYDITTGRTTQLTDNDYYDSIPVIDGTKISWYGFPSSNGGEIFVAQLPEPATCILFGLGCFLFKKRQ